MSPNQMIQQLVAQKYNLFNVGENKIPVNKKGNKMTDWQLKNYEELVKEHNYNSNLWGISLGRQENNRCIMSLDFDIYIKKTDSYCEKMKERFNTYDSNCANKNGMYSSSTCGNKNVLIDYTDSETLMSWVNEFTKVGKRVEGKRDFQFKLENNHFEIFLKGNQVIPPSQTKCKKTEQLGAARTLLEPDNMFYVINSDENCFTFQFVKDLFEENDRINPPPSAAPKRKRVPESSSPSITPTPTTKNCADDSYNVNLNEYMEYAEIISMDHIQSGAYDTWIKLIWALKSEGDDKLKEVAERLAERAERDLKVYVDKFWDNNGKGGLTIGTFLHFARISDEKAYFAIKEKYHPSIESVFRNHITSENMIMTATHKQFANLYFETRKNKVFLQDNHIYLYYKNEWRKEIEKDCKLLKCDISNTIASYIKACLQFIHSEMCEQLNDKDKTQALVKLQKNMISVKIATENYSFTTHVCSTLKDQLTDQFTKQVFDIGSQDHYNINFKNGVYDMKAKLFRKRFETDLITKTLDYDYITKDKVPIEISKDVYRFFEEIQPDESQRKFTLGYLAYCITGNIEHQIFKMNIGYTASNGKSTEMSIHHTVFPIYTKKLNSQTFNEDYTKKHKHIMSLLTDPIRLAYMEELGAKKLDIDFTKDFVDAKNISCEVMYGTDTTKPIQAKLMTCSNKDFKMDVDEGIKRRGKVQHYRSQFTDKEGEIDKEKHFYNKDKKFPNKFDDVLYKNAYFHLLLQYVDKLEVPEKNEDEFHEMCNDNDTFKNIFEDNFTITKDVNDIVNWKQCVDILTNGKKFERTAITSDMKRLGIEYCKNKKKNNVAGCYIGLQIKTIEESGTLNDLICGCGINLICICKCEHPKYELCHLSNSEHKNYCIYCNKWECRCKYK